MKHFAKSPSAAKRWLVQGCSKSIILSEDHVSEGNVYTAEGTKAHDLCEACLKADNWKTFLGDADASDEMKTAVEAYCRFISALRGHILLSEDIERTFVSKRFTGFGGTADYCSHYFGDDGKECCHTVDFKFGAGVLVPAEKNPQLLSYLVLIREAKQLNDLDLFRATIVQPRLDHVETVEFSKKDLDDFEKELHRVENELESGGKFVAGEACHWCPAMSRCPEIYRLAGEAINSAAEPPPEQHDDDVWIERWAELLRATPAIKRFLDQIPDWLLGEMQRGKKVDGFKVVRRHGNKTWKEDEETTLKKLARKKIGKKAATKTVLLTPTQLKKAGYQVDDLAHRPDRGLKVVGSDDRREAVEFVTPDNVFSIIE